MDKSVILGLILFIVTEIFSVVALFSSDWVVSEHIGNVRMGLTVLCHSPPGKQTLCTFTVPHASWLAGTLFLVMAVLMVGLSICLLVVALHKRKKAFEQGAKWTGLGGVVFLCLVGIIFPLGFSTVELGGKPFLLPTTYNIGYSYILFNIAIVTCIAALLATNRFFACRLLRRR